MPFIEPAHLPVPAGNQGPYAAADIMALADALGDAVVLYAVDEADRDARFATVPLGQLVACAVDGSLWMKRSAFTSTWWTLFADTGWYYSGSGFTSETGWEVVDGGAIVRQVGAVCEVRATYTRLGDPIVASSTGHLADEKVGSIPAGFGPLILSVQDSFRATFSSGGAFLTTAGGLWITDANPDSTINTGDGVSFHFTYLRG